MKKDDNNIKKKKVILKVPSRYHLDVMDIQKMDLKRVGGGGIGVAINMHCLITIEIIEENDDIILSKKKTLIKYYLDLMREVLNIKKYFKVSGEFDKRYGSHNGMGSNAMIQTGIVYGINYLCGEPLSNSELITLLQKNYYEEENGEITNRVYCSGVGNNTILFGGLCFIDENGKLIYSKNIPSNFKLITIKASFENIFENQNIDKDEVVVNLRKKNDVNRYFRVKNKIIRNKIIPDLKNEDYSSLIEQMKEFSMFDDSFVLSQKCKINKITYEDFYNCVKDIPNLIMRVASNYPNVCLITNDVEKVKNICKKYKIDFSIYDINNSGIEIIEEAM